MKLYLLTQDANNDYDTYDSAIVAANNKEEARFIHPDNHRNPWDGNGELCCSWCDAASVKVEYIGKAKAGTKKGVILSSFNAG